ncbi:MAG: hypothetical protein QXH07_04780 [Thermoplasmata archaeon]
MKDEKETSQNSELLENTVKESSQTKEKVDETKETPSIILSNTTNFRLILLSIFFNIITTLGILYGYNKYYAHQFYETSLSNFINDQRILYLDKKLSIKQVQNNIKSFAQDLRNMPKNAVILNSEAVLKGAKEISYKKYINGLDEAKKDIIRKYGVVGNIIVNGTISN